VFAQRLFSKWKRMGIFGCAVLVGLGAVGLAGARLAGVYPKSGLVATTPDMPPPQLDWVHGPLVGRASILASRAAGGSLIGGHVPNLVAAGLGRPNQIEVSSTVGSQRRSLAMRFGAGRSRYWVVASPQPGLAMMQMQVWPRLCACGGIVSLRSTSGVLLDQLGEGRSTSVTWLDGAGYRWSVIQPPGSARTDSQVEGLARSLVAQQGIKAP
jgi:hypothetical protein